MSRQLPTQPNLRHLKNEARDLHRAVADDDQAAGRIAAGLPRLSGATPDRVREAAVSLQEAQHVLAREYGFSSWADLAAAVAGDAVAGDAAVLALPLAQLTVDQARQIGHRISRLVKQYGDSVATIRPPTPFYRALEALGAASPSLQEPINLGADGAEPDTIREFMRNRRDTELRNLEIRHRLVLVGALAIHRGEHRRLLLHRLDTVCNTGRAIEYRDPEGTVEQFRQRMAAEPLSDRRHEVLAMAIGDLNRIAQDQGAAALAEVVDAIDDVHLRAAVQKLAEQVDAETLARDLERDMAPEVERTWRAYTALTEALCAALEGKVGAELDGAVEEALAPGRSGATRVVTVAGSAGEVSVEVREASER